MLSLKSSKTSKPGASERNAADASQTGQSVLAERDARIVELERQLAEERENAARLREAADGLRFKSEILEKSYAKQLADTRAKLAAVEQALGEHKANQAAYGADHEETVRLLKEARLELEQAKLDRDQIRSQAKRAGWTAPAGRSDTSETSEGTINQLMAGAGWLAKAEAPAAGSHLAAKVAKPEEAPLVDMIAPELVFTKDKDE